MARAPSSTNTSVAPAQQKKTTIRVRAGKNGAVFREGESRRLDDNGTDTTIISETIVEVPNTQYYRRRIAKGDLVAVED